MKDAAEQAFNRYMTPSQKSHFIRECGKDAAVTIAAAYISDGGKVIRRGIIVKVRNYGLARLS